MADSIGIDLAEIARIERLYVRYHERFLDRVLGPQEKAAFEARGDKALFLAGRFAAKEALVKALGQYLVDRPPLSSLQILNDATGRPHVSIPDDLSSKLGGIDFLVSISHEKHYAIAMVTATETK